MIDENTAQQRENLFKEYRDNLEKYKAILDELDAIKTQENAATTKRDKILKDLRFIKNAIDIMIENDLDPVVAKIQASSGNVPDNLEDKSRLDDYFSISLDNTINTSTWNDTYLLPSATTWTNKLKKLWDKTK